MSGVFIIGVKSFLSGVFIMIGVFLFLWLLVSLWMHHGDPKPVPVATEVVFPVAVMVPVQAQGARVADEIAVVVLERDPTRGASNRDSLH
jgi:hypothetical protein